MSLTAAQAYFAAIVAGAALWQGTAMLGGRREAWDSSLYWMVAYPLAMVVAGVLAYAHPVRPWRWALSAMLVQAVVMVVGSGSDFGLLPLGLIMFAVLAIPPMGVASVVGSMRLRRIGP